MREEVGELLAELGDLWRDGELAVALTRIAGVVVLMVILGGVEGLERQYLGDDGIIPEVLRLEVTDDFQRGGLLPGQCGEDGGAVLGANVTALAVEGGGVVDGEEDVQEDSVGDMSGVKGDAHDLGVTGVPGADLLVGGINVGTAGITGDDISYACDLVEDGFEAPEATAGEDCDLKGEDGGFGFHDVIVH